MTFSAEGHIDIAPTKLLEMAKESARFLVNGYLLVGTPKIFNTHEQYCRFKVALGERLQVPPQSIVIRGSCKLGYSIAPRVDKAWREMTGDSDIDVAIADLEYFTRLDNEIRQWESRQRVPYYKSPSYHQYAKRQQYRQFNCIADDLLPPNTCVAHKDAMEGFKTEPFCDLNRDISAFVFRDWWSLRNRYEFDLGELVSAVEKGIVPQPESASETPDGSAAKQDKV